MEERKDICEGYERDSVQQLDKLAKDKNERFPIYPLTYIQAVYDARTKERLDAILWKCNNVYLPWMGSAGDTRIQLPFWMRRKGIIITYKNLAEETITEKLTYDLCIADDFLRLDSSWTRITDALPVGGNITIGSNGNWFQDGVDTGFKAQGPKGDNGLTPMLRTVNNKLQYSYDGEVWNEISEYIAAWFRYQDNKIQISRDQKTWSDLSAPFTQDLYIKGYVATSSALPSTGVKQGDIYMVGPTYAAEDTGHTNPIYRMYVYNDSGWVDNGTFQSIAAGVVQTIGNSETEVMSQKAVSSIVGLDTYPVFSDTKDYVKGEIVNYEGFLYEFTADHAKGAWSGTDVRETSLREEVLSINDTFTDNTNLNKYIGGIYFCNFVPNEDDVYYLEIGYNPEGVGWFIILYKNNNIWANWYTNRDYNNLEEKPTQSFFQLHPYLLSGNKDEIITVYINQYEYSFLDKNNEYIKGEIYKNKAISLNKNYNIIHYLNDKVSFYPIINEYVLELYCDKSYWEYFNENDKPLIMIGHTNDVTSDGLGYYVAIGVYDGSSTTIVKYFSVRTSDISTLNDNFIELTTLDAPIFYAVINLKKFKEIPIGITHKGYIQINKMLNPIQNQIVINNLDFKLKLINKYKILQASSKVEAVEFNYGGYIDKYGKYIEFTSSTITVCSSDYYPISPYISYYYTGREYLDVRSWAIYDENKKCISVSNKELPEAVEYSNELIKDIPNNAKYIRFSSYYLNVYRWPHVCIRSVSNDLQWLNKKWCVFGDSLTEYNSRTNLHYFDYIAESTGLKIYNCGLSGSGYKEREDEDKAFYQRINGIDIDFDVITIFGSGNDTRAGEIGQPTDTTTDTICGCVNKTLDNLFAIKPTAIVGIVTPVLWPNRTALDNNTFMVDYSKALVEICELRSIPCLDLSKCSLMRPNDIEFRKLCYSKDDGDGVHPDEMGHKILAPRFYNFLQSLII